MVVKRFSWKVLVQLIGDTFYCMRGYVAGVIPCSLLNYGVILWMDVNKWQNLLSPSPMINFMGFCGNQSIFRLEVG
mgnify:CR=1 FL=1